MLSAQMILNYWSDATRLGCEPNVSLAADDARWEASMHEVRAGVLNTELTRSLFSAFSRACPHIEYGSRNVPVVLCLKTLVGAPDPEPPQLPIRRPLLLLRAQVRTNGSLEPSGVAPWIPRDMIAHDGPRNAALAVCDLDAYRAHQEALENLPQPEGWKEALRRAEDLFSSVCMLSDQSLANQSLALLDERVPIALWEHPDALAQTSRVLSRLEVAQSVPGTSLLSEPLVQLLSAGTETGEHAEPETDARERFTTIEEQLSDDALLRYKLLCGSLADLPALSERTREALFALTQESDRALVALEAAPASAQEVVCLMHMANTLTQAALRGTKVPAMVCVAPQERIVSLVGRLSDREQAGMASLPSRWVPRISYDGDPHEPTLASRRILGPLPHICVTHVSSATGELTDVPSALQAYGHSEEGAGSIYSDGWYVPKASTYYLDCASSFLGVRMHTLEEAAQRLSERLRIVDQDRCDLIDAYALLCRAELQMRKRDDLVGKISRLRRRHTELRARLAFWQELGRLHPLRKLLASAVAPNQSALIKRNAYEGETLAEGRTMIEDVCEAYRHELDHVESDIDRMRLLSGKLSRQVRAVAGEGERCSQLVVRLAQRCGLSQTQSDLLDHAIDGGEVSLANLDQILNETVRAAEFWLALHVFEAHWLTACSRSEGFSRHAQGEGLAGMQALAHLFPFCFVPFELAPSVLSAPEGQQLAPTTSQRLDLAVVIDAHELSVPEGAAVLAFANKACLAGSPFALAPSQPRAAMFDQMRVGSLLAESAWEELLSRKLCASGSSSLLAAALERTDVTRVPLLDMSSGYAELSELRSELVGEDRLSTSRKPAFGADDPAYPFATIMPVVSHVLVPDSAWEQFGSSRKNPAEALALMRWLERHAQEILDHLDENTPSPLVLIAPYRAQAELLDALLARQEGAWAKRVETFALADVGARSWPVVIASLTCGPDSFKGDSDASVASLMNLALSAATCAFVCFCGGSWVRSSNAVAQTLMGRTMRIGRLFSVPQGRHAAPAETPRTKPLSLTSLLKNMFERGDIASVPATDELNRALRDAGLIVKVKEGKRSGWKPTPAGKEVGILEEADRAGNPFCTYTTTAEAIVARVVGEISNTTSA